MGTHLTGYYVRAMHEGKWGSWDIAELSEDELRVFLSDYEKERLRSWIVSLCRFIRDSAQVSEASGRGMSNPNIMIGR